MRFRVSMPPFPPERASVNVTVNPPNSSNDRLGFVPEVASHPTTASGASAKKLCRSCPPAPRSTPMRFTGPGVPPPLGKPVSNDVPIRNSSTTAE